MKKLMILSLLVAFCSPLVASSHMTHEQIKKEFSEPGHIPQGLAPRIYPPLSQVMSKGVISKLKAKRRARKEAALSHTQERDIYSFGSPEEKSAPLASQEEQDDELPSEVDLRKYDSYIHSQFGGTCTAHGLSSAIENLLNRNGPASPISVRYLWSQYRQYSATAAINAAAGNKQIDEKYWPENDSSPSVDDVADKGHVQLTSAVYLEDDVNLVMQKLAKGFPVYIALSVPSDLASCRATIRPTSAVTSGGHAMEVPGFKLDPASGISYLTLKNSWGEECGDHGYQYLPISFCQKDGAYCLFWSIETVGVD